MYQGQQKIRVPNQQLIANGMCRDAPPRCAMKGSRIYVVVMATFFAGWGEVKSQWVEASANSTQLARLFSLQGSCHTEPEAFVIIFVHCPAQYSKARNTVDGQLVHRSKAS